MTTTETTDETTRMVFVDLAAQHAEIADEIDSGLRRVIQSTAFIEGPDVKHFEEEWARYCGLAHCVGVASGTDAIEFALRAAGVGRGHEVILPANTFVATAEAVVRSGARPVFADCDDTYLLMDPATLEPALTSATRAVVPVHLYGQMAPMERILPIAEAHGLSVIEDAAQSHGATRFGRRSGQWGLLAATSFYPGKNLGAYGDGGAVMTDTAEMALALRRMRNHGGIARYEHASLGFNSRLDTIQAVVLRAKLRRLDVWNELRRQAADRYNQLLSDIPGVRLPEVIPGNDPVWHLYVVRVPERDRVLATLQSNGIPAAIHYPVPVHETGAFRLGRRRHSGALPVAETAASEILSLPIHPHLSSYAQERVAECLAAALT